MKANTDVGILKIDRSHPFNAEWLMGSGSRVWKGSKDGDGEEGLEQQDARSMFLTEVDLSKIRFETALKSTEKMITGEEKLDRLKEDKKLILPDTKISEALRNEPGRKTLKHIESMGITWFDLPGTVLRGPDGGRCILIQFLDGRNWGWSFRYLRFSWNFSRPSLVIENA